MTIYSNIEIRENAIAHLGDHHTHVEKCRRDFLEWLSPLDFQAKHQDVVGQRLIKTGEWLLETEDFRWWLSGDSVSPKTFSCHGAIGIGKTFLVSTVVDYLVGLRENDNSIGVAWVYFDSKDENSRRSANLMRSLLRQLIQLHDEMSEGSKKLDKKHTDGHSFPEIHEVLKLFQSEIRRFSRVYVVIDALNECEEDKHKLEEELLDPLRSCVNLMITTRTPIRYRDPKDGRVETRKHTMKPDNRVIGAYIDARMAYRKTIDYKELDDAIKEDIDLRKQLIKKLVDSADGILLFVKLDMDYVSRVQSIGDIKTFINRSRRKDGNARLEEIVKKIKDQENGDGERAERILSWVTYAFRHLSIDELQDALAAESEKTPSFDKSKRALLDGLEGVCGGLLVVDSTRKKVHLFHNSVYKYFHRHPIAKKAKVHNKIAQTCLKYILGVHRNDHFIDENLENKLEDFPLLKYAIQHWGDHTRETKDPLSLGVQNLALEYLNDKKLLEFTVRAGAIAGQHYPDYTRHFTQGMTSIQVAASFGLEMIVEGLIPQEFDIIDVDADGRTALHIAAEGGYLDVVKLLLTRLPGTRDQKDHHKRIPLHLAALNGHQKVVRWLAGNGSDPCPNLEIRDSYNRTALHLAVLNGHKQTVRSLLKRRANPNATDVHQQTPLHFVALSGHQAIARELLKTRHTAVDITTKDAHHRTALHIAAWRGNREIVEILLSEELALTVEFFDETDKHGLSALHYAASQGHQRVVKMLLEKGANIHARNNADWTALHSASLRRRDIENPLVVNKFSGVQSTPSLHCEKQPESLPLRFMASVISLNTLERQMGRISPEKIDNIHVVPVSQGISKASQPDILGLLATQDELISRRCDLKCNHEAVVKLLLDRSSTIDRKCQAVFYTPLWGYMTAECTPLHLALLSGHDAVARALLEAGCKPHEKCHFGFTPMLSAKMTPLHLATVVSSKSMVESLLTKEKSNDQAGVNLPWGVRFNQVDLSGGIPGFRLRAEGTAFHLAVATRNKVMAQLLKKRGVDLNAPLSLTVGLSTKTGRVEVRSELRRRRIIGGKHKNKDVEIDLDCKFNFDYPDSSGPVTLDNVPVKTTVFRLVISPSFGVELNAKCQIGDTLREVLLDKILSFASMEESLVPLWLFGIGVYASLKSKAEAERLCGRGLIGIRIKMRPLDVAALVGDANAVGLLYERTHNVNTLASGELSYQFGLESDVQVRVGGKPIHLATLNGTKDVVCTILKKEPLASNHKGTINIEINHRFSQDASSVSLSLRVEEATAMHLAICRGLGDVLKVLLAENADPDALASITANFKIRGEIQADMVLEGYLAPFFLAVLLRNAELVEQFLVRKLVICGSVQFKISYRVDRLGLVFEGSGTAMVLHVAAWQGSIAIVERLLEYGADVDTNLPGTIWVRSQTDAAVPINMKLEKNLTALHLAAFLGNDRLVKLLLKNKANVEAKSGNQMTPLDVAQAMRNESIVLLLQPGTTKTDLGDSARDPPPASSLNQALSDCNTTEQLRLDKHLDRFPERQEAETSDHEEEARNYEAEIRDLIDNASSVYCEPDKESGLIACGEETRTREYSLERDQQPQRRNHRNRHRSGSRHNNRSTSRQRYELREPRNVFWSIVDGFKARFLPRTVDDINH